MLLLLLLLLLLFLFLRHRLTSHYYLLQSRPLRLPFLCSFPASLSVPVLTVHPIHDGTSSSFGKHHKVQLGWRPQRRWVRLRLRRGRLLRLMLLRGRSLW